MELKPFVFVDKDQDGDIWACTEVWAANKEQAEELYKDHIRGNFDDSDIPDDIIDTIINDVIYVCFEPGDVEVINRPLSD